MARVALPARAGKATWMVKRRARHSQVERTFLSVRPATDRNVRRTVAVTSADAKRSGYTLIEILIVMAVLAAMAAFTVPAMRGPLDKSRLRAAGRDVSAALSKARALAIREGVTMQFMYRSGGSEWQIQRTGLPPMQSRQMDSADAAADSSNASAGFTASQTGGAGIVRSGQLPPGIFFQAADQNDELTDSASMDSFAPSDELSAEATDSWSTPITFRPSGRSQDAELILQGARSFAVRIRLRGLTSAVRYSAPFRSADANQLIAGTAQSGGADSVSEVAR